MKSVAEQAISYSACIRNARIATERESSHDRRPNNPDKFRNRSPHPHGGDGGIGEDVSVKKTADEKELMYLKYAVRVFCGDKRPLHILMQDHTIPDYPNDLNATHAAEEKLSPEQSHAYNEYLYFHTPQDQHLFHVTARQRAEAFIAVMENKQ